MIVVAFGRRVARLLCAAIAVMGLLLTSRTAGAYPWMIRHDYTGCAMCHMDPTGAGVLTAYGRAQGDLLLRMRYGQATEEPGPSAGFAWGLVQPPEWFLPSGSFRDLLLATKVGSSGFTTTNIVMQADLRLGVATANGFRAYGSIGTVSSNGSGASLAGSVVSREHWLGWAFGSDQQFLLRAGRIDLPYGIRMIDHTLFVRVATRTDLNDTQQHGVAFAYASDFVRGELMAIAGNYQLSPDAYRERGYSGYLELTPLGWLAVGGSSLVTHAAKDLYLRVPNTRQAHGLFVRAAPVRPLVVMAEGDLVAQSPNGAPRTLGYASMLQLDLEAIQGLHAIATGEAENLGGPSEHTSWGGWFGIDWFFAPHADVRVDAMRRSMSFGPQTIPVTALMGQIHVYL